MNIKKQSSVIIFKILILIFIQLPLAEGAQITTTQNEKELPDTKVVMFHEIGCCPNQQLEKQLLTFNDLSICTNGKTKFTLAPHFQDDYLYVGIKQGIYHAHHGGTGWIKINNGPLNDIPNVLQPYKGYLYAGGQGIFRSNDNGASWQQIDDELINVNTLCVHEGYLYAGFDFKGVYVTTDGEKWLPVNKNLRFKHLSAVAFSVITLHSHEGFLYAGTYGNGIFKTNDGGKNWIPVDNNLAHQGQDMHKYTVLALQSYNGFLYASIEKQGIFKTKDGGKSWSKVDLGVKNLNISALYSYDNFLYAKDHDVLLQTSDGENWIQSSNVIINDNVYDLHLYNGYLFAGTLYGIFRTKEPIEMEIL